jgi:hypothetical protein
MDNKGSGLLLTFATINDRPDLVNSTLHTLLLPFYHLARHFVAGRFAMYDVYETLAKAGHK